MMSFEEEQEKHPELAGCQEEEKMDVSEPPAEVETTEEQKQAEDSGGGSGSFEKERGTLIPIRNDLLNPASEVLKEDEGEGGANKDDAGGSPQAPAVPLVDNFALKIRSMLQLMAVSAETAETGSTADDLRKATSDFSKALGELNGWFLSKQSEPTTLEQIEKCKREIEDLELEIRRKDQIMGEYKEKLAEWTNRLS